LKKLPAGWTPYSERNTWFVDKLDELYRSLGGDPLPDADSGNSGGGGGAAGGGGGGCSGIDPLSFTDGYSRGRNRMWAGHPMYGKEASLRPPANLKHQYDVILVDEMQDLSESIVLGFEQNFSFIRG
jgi:hypothetical protein